MKHTAGPWRVFENHGHYFVEGQAFDGSWKYIAEEIRGQNRIATQANARLIAAAPELLEACKDMVSRFTGLFDAYVRKSYAEGSDPDSDLGLSLIGAQEAIAKAEGQ